MVIVALHRHTSFVGVACPACFIIMKRNSNNNIMYKIYNIYVLFIANVLDTNEM